MYSNICSYNAKGYERFLVIVKPFSIEFYKNDDNQITLVKTFPVDAEIK